MLVSVHKSGLFSLFAHNHEIEAPIASGSVDLGAPAAVELRIETARLRVLDPEVGAGTRAEIERTMLGPQVLAAAQYPEIDFVSRHVAQTGPQSWRIAGELTLHGQTHPVEFAVSEADGVYRGSALVRQSDFDITPIRVAGGTIKVKNDVRIHFEIRLENSVPTQGPQASRIPCGFSARRTASVE